VTFLGVSPAAPARSPMPAADGPGFADRSLIRKTLVRGPARGLGSAVRAQDGAWWCPITPQRTLVLDGQGDGLDLTCAYAAIELAGPRTDDVIARFCALDVRAASLPVGGFRPGSVARTPGFVLRTGETTLLLLVGWALGAYLWTVVADAAQALDA
jgi:glycine cleavage system aminomethyltransferase T